ncbi:MAG: carbohydrate binding domain-containing protein [Planctomycetota bacterium]|jgi:hypothetical protein
MTTARKPPRRGSIYVLVLGTGMVVSVLALSAVLARRIQRSTFEAADNLHQARLNAEAAIRIGMLRIENDPDWRYNFPNGVWEAGVDVGQGTYTLKGRDPDGVLDDGPEDPLVLIGTGRKPSAIHEEEETVQKIRVILSPQNRALDCLESALHAGGNVTFTTATVDADQPISAGGNIDASASNVNADVEAAGSITGSTYHGGQSAGVDPRQIPDGAVFDYYMANGTWIDVSDVVTSPSPNLLDNPGGEEGTPPWFPVGSCTVAATSSDPHSGTSSVLCTDRDELSHSPAQYVTEELENGQVYHAEAMLKWSGAGDWLMIRLKLVSTGDGTRYFNLTPWTYVDNAWTKIEGNAVISWTGTLTEARWYVSAYDEDSSSDFYLDDAVFKLPDPPPHTIHREVVSPASNPFGPANPQGIYVIDCRGQDLYVEKSRIVGTLVLLNPGAGSAVRNAPINWEPAVANFPALLTDGDFAIRSSDSGLSELITRTNFNPPGTSYAGLGEDADQDDTYASEINGLVYSSGTLTFRNQSALTGAVIAAGDLDVSDALTIQHDPTYRLNPPPGFSGPEEIKIVLDSAEKVPE